VKRLIAYVRFDPPEPHGQGANDLPWRWAVETSDEHGTSAVLHESFANRALAAMVAAERTALREGFGLDWNGLVARGVPLDPSALPSTEGT
jgi:hypothetical protein